MPKCSGCGEDSKKLENWGHHDLCPECVKKYSNEWKKKPRDSRNITLEKPNAGENAKYNPYTGDIELSRFTSYKDTFRIINHEFLHFIIHKLTDIRSTFQCDNIVSEVDPYHSNS